MKTTNTNPVARVPASRATTTSVRRILVVEDDHDTRLGLELRLRSAGYEVAIAEYGTHGLALAQRLRPDLILLDLGLPDLDGLEVLRRLALAAPRCPPILVLSAWDARSFESRALEHGALLYMQKPVSDFELVTAIDAVLNSRE